MPGEATGVFMLQTLKELLRSYTDLKEGEKRQLKALEGELDTLEQFLEASSKTQNNEIFIRVESQTRDLFYEVEDTVELCRAKSDAAKTKNIFTRTARKLSPSMAKKVRILREERVKPIVDLIRREFVESLVHSVANGSSTQYQEMGQSSKFHVPKQNDDPRSYKHRKFVDFKGEAVVRDYLMNPTKMLDVISITGLPGLGKSTFALKIFEHHDIARAFERRIWISYSYMSSSAAVFRNILKQITTKDSISEESDADIISTVRACLENKKWLLVVDNISTIKEWEELEKILPKDNSEAKVLLTTRDNAVAEHAKMQTNPHQLEHLGEKESLELLKSQVFNNPKDFYPGLQKIGKTIAKECGGVPLLILLIAGHLKGFFTKSRNEIAVREEWTKTAKMVGEIIKLDKDKSISGYLERSYYSLARGSRECFLYMGLFPANQEILASTLTTLWISEGFIQPTYTNSVEIVANEVLDELINKNLIEVVTKNLEQVKKCKVHELIHGFCITKAREENFFSVIKLESTEGTHEPPEVKYFHRVCLHSDPSRFLSRKPKGPHVRSFLCLLSGKPKEPRDLNLEHMSTIPKAFKLLRILSCESLNFGNFPKLRNLILLKHITLSIGDPNVLPKEISKLLRLQTLIVYTKSHTINVEANMSEMIELKCLKTKAAISLKDENWKGTNSSNNLETMSRLSPDSCTSTLSTKAPNLKTLGIRGRIEELDFQTFSFVAFGQLENLKIQNYILDDSASVYPMPSLPQAYCFPPKLVSLTLSETYLQLGTNMPILENISTLEILKLKDNALTESFLWDAGKSSGFPKLQFLLIQNSQLNWWVTSPAYLPNLRCLVIKDCPFLQNIPESLEKNLEKLEIESVRKPIARAARDIKSRKQKEGYPFILKEGDNCDLSDFIRYIFTSSAS